MHFSCSSVYAVYRLQYTVHWSTLVSTSPLPTLSANMSSLEIIRATNAAGKGTCHFATLPFLPGLPSIPLGPTAPGTPTKSSAALKYSQNTVNFKLSKSFSQIFDWSKYYIPGNPGNPCSPFSPRDPFTPGFPANPGGPKSPMTPGSPGGPGAPGSPIEPPSPLDEGNPPPKPEDAVSLSCWT